MDEKQIAQVWNDHSRGYDTKHAETDGIEAYTRILSQRLGETPKNVLDMGTGTGFLAVLLAQMGHHCTGIDLAEKMLQAAEQKAQEQNLKINFVKGNWNNLRYEDETFDAIVNRCVMWAVFDPTGVLAEWKRVLSPGGQLLCFCFYDAKGVIPNHYDEETENRLPLKRISPQQMAEMLESNGFTKVCASTLDGVPVNKNFPAWYLLEGIKPAA